MHARLLALLGSSSLAGRACTLHSHVAAVTSSHHVSLPVVLALPVRVLANVVLGTWFNRL